MSLKVRNIRLPQESSSEPTSRRKEQEQPTNNKQKEENEGGGDDDFDYDELMWNPYLYSLQQKAPKPRPIACKPPLLTRPSQYGSEYHGSVSRSDANALLVESGSYLVRTSLTSPGDFSLSLNFEGRVKHFKLYHDDENGLHYVGEKRFDTMHDLVKDGLITYYIEAHAQSYIEQLPEEGLKYTKNPRLRARPPKASVIDHFNGESGGDGELYHEAGVVFRRSLRENSKRAATEGNQSVEVSRPASAFVHPTRRMRVLIAADNPLLYEKAHVFKVSTFHGPNWCDFCRNFLWGWRQQGVRCADCAFQCHKGCSAHTLKDCQPDRRRLKRLFGADLTTVAKAYGMRYPIVLEKCITEIESRGLDSEGLYRVPGFADDVVSIKHAFDKDGATADVSSDRYPDINTIACVLKQYLRELPIPLIPFEEYQAFIDAMRLETCATQLYALKLAIHRLSKPHFNSLRFLIEHLDRVSQHSDKNLMTMNNLGLVFGPTVMRPGNTIIAHGTAALVELPLQKKAVTMMLEHREFIFKE